MCWGLVALGVKGLGEFTWHPKHAHYPVAACWQLAPGIGWRSLLNRDPHLSRSVVIRTSCSKRYGRSYLILNGNWFFRGTPNGARKSLTGDCGSREAPIPLQLPDIPGDEKSPNNWLPVRRGPCIRSWQAHPGLIQTQLVTWTLYHNLCYKKR